MDEHLSPTVAHRLTTLGFDVTSARDRSLLGLEDWDLMEWCGREGRAMCTRNAVDFRREHDRCLARGEIHFGIVTVGEWPPEQLFGALKAFLERTEDSEMLNQLVPLDEPLPDAP